MTEPFISIITYGRNDGYAPNYAKKVNRATAVLAGQLERAGIDAEILFSEWNPPADRPKMVDLFELPERMRHVSVRGFVIGEEHHRGFAGADERGFHGGEAANVGIRRARGRFVLPKSSDTIFSPALIDLLARRELDVGNVYRVNRHDVAVTDDIWDLGDLELIRRLEELPSLVHGVLVQPPQWALPDLHTNGCGDFLLMSAENWSRLRGYPYDPTVLNFDVDSLVLHAAVAVGARECRLPTDCCVYKPTHGNLNSSRVVDVWTGWQRWLDAFLTKRGGNALALRGRILFNYPRRQMRGLESVLGQSIARNFVHPARRWSRGSAFQPSQPANWGLRDVALEERTVCKGDWETAGEA